MDSTTDILSVDVDPPNPEKRGWQLDEALQFVRSLERHLKDSFGCHLALGGSVLHSGSSEKDLDIIVYPHSKRGRWDTSAVRAALSAMLGYPVERCQNAYRDSKEVAWVRIKTGKHAGQRIDFFFLS